MMQSILLTSPTKPQNNERLSDTSLNEETASGLGSEEGEVKSRFSDLFDSLLGDNKKEVEGKGKVDKDSAVEVGAEQEGKIDSPHLLEFSSEQVDSDLVSEKNEEELADDKDKKEEDIFASEWVSAQVENVVHADNVEDKESVAIQRSDFDPSVLEDSVEDKLGALNIERLDGSDDLQEVEGQNQTAMLAQSSILEQIEAAKKINTQLAEVQKKDQGDSAIPELSSHVKKGQEKQSNSFNESERPSLQAATTDTNSESESLKIETAQVIVDKIEPFSLIHKGEVERNPVSSIIDANAPRVANMDISNLSKSINQNLASAAQSPLLDQPLDLQAKHASALLGERILMMIGQGKQEVNIRLDPAELGSMYIKLQVQHDQVQLTIHTQVAQSRDIIEQNLPRLREQLAQQGISLGETSVEQQSQQQNHNPQGKQGVQDRGRMLASDSSLQSMGDKTEWIASKIELPAQGIDYYA